MSTLKTTNIQHISAANPAITLAADGTAAATVSGINGGPLAGFRNAIINGNFDHWQRGTSFTAAEYGPDRWFLTRLGTTRTTTRESFALGQTDVPGEPVYFMRNVVTSVAGVTNFAVVTQRIEDVRSFAGQQVTLSFWAKADAAKPIAVELMQHFGTGGSPSEDVIALGVTKTTLSTSWQKITVSVTLPSISGKTLGSDNNSYLAVGVWMDAGSNLNSRTDSLGQQSGTFDIAQVQVEAGPVATPFERRPIGTELALCQRYYYQPTDSVRTLFKHAQMGASGRNLIGAVHSLPVEMRAAPTITYTDDNGTANRWTVGTSDNVTPSTGGISITRTMLRADLNFGAISQDYTTAVTRNLTADAEL